METVHERTEHERTVHGRNFKEVKVCFKLIDGSLLFIQHKSIDDRYLSVLQIMNNGQLGNETINTNLKENEINSFKEEWEAGWNQESLLSSWNPVWPSVELE